MDNFNNFETIDFRELFSILIKRKWYAISFFILVFLLSLIYVITQVPVYSSSSTVMIKLEPPRVLPLSTAVDLSQTDYWFARDYYNTQIKIIKSRKLAQKVIERLQLKSPEDTEKLMEPNLLLTKIDVQPVKDTQLVNIISFDTNPQMAKMLVNVFAEEYSQLNLEERVSVAETAVKWLSKRLDAMKRTLKDTEMKLYTFRKENDLISITNEEELLKDKFTIVNKNYNMARSERATNEAMYSYYTKLYKNNSDNYVNLLSIFNDDVLEKLQLDLLNLQEEKSTLSHYLLSNHPKMKKINLQIDYIKSRIKGEIENILNMYKSNYKLTLVKEKNLKKLIEEYKDEVLSLNKKMAQFKDLELEVDKNQQLYNLLLQKLKENDIATHLKENNISVVEKGKLPVSPVKPRVKIILLLSILLGLFGGVGIAIFVNYIDNTINTQDDIEKYVHLPVIGIVPSLTAEEVELVRKDKFPFFHPKSTSSEHIRSVRTSLLFMSADKPLKTIALTSSFPLEGKSTLVSNIAIAMAQNDSKTIIIDADLRRGRLHSTFNVKREKGITNLITNQYLLDEVIQKTEVNNLDIIVRGPVPPNPAELLGSSKMKSIIEELKTRYDRIIIDTPPIIPVTDPLVISKLVDGVIVVVKIGKVSRESVRKSKEKLQSVNANILGVILNDLDFANQGYGYNYYSSYYYSSDDESDEL